MKKFVSLLSLLIVFFSCSEDETIEVVTGKLTVLEYLPAPGQFINENVNFTTMEEAVKWAQDRIDAQVYVSLGSFGGYLTVKMPKAINNRKGYDFGVMGNAFEGSSEPGIVWVSRDVNGNGIADDPWYELKGSDSSDTERNYSVTYTRPSAAGDIPWTDNKGNSGVIKYLPQYHDQIYYPKWVTTDSYTLTGSMLEHRTIKEGDEWVNLSFGWGYADNKGSDVITNSNGDYRYNQFELDNAIDANGNPVALTEIHFVKVQSAILHNADILGELSTEVCGFKIF
ncbi:MAG: cell surface protein [Bacteroides sp.]|nr:cell surface protein [Bacteroides sp.]